MIEFLFSMLLVPLMPELADPQETHASRLHELERRLNEGRSSPAVAPVEPVAGLVDKRFTTAPSDLPPISGRVFAWSATNQNASTSVEESEAVAGGSVDGLRLTGVIESAGQRVAILNDGQADYVVGVGSYVLQSHRVVSLGANQVVLSPIDTKTGGRRLELNLMPVIATGGF